MSFWKSLGIFLAAFFYDVICTLYIAAVASGSAWLAAGYSALLIALGGYGLFLFIEDRRYIVPEIIGAFLGTFFTVRYL